MPPIAPTESELDALFELVTSETWLVVEAAVLIRMTLKIDVLAVATHITE
jgi:hypothetical protein